MLVCGTLLLLTSTAPWTPPEIGTEPSIPDAARDFAERLPSLDTDVSNESVAALGSPLNEETADAGPDTDTEIATEPVPEPSPNTDLATASPAPEPIAGDKAQAAKDEIAGLLAELTPRAIASDLSGAATEEVASVMAGLSPAPPSVLASEKTEPGTEEVAGLAAALLPVAQPLAERDAEPGDEVTAEPASAQPTIGESRVTHADLAGVSATIAAMPAAYLVAANETEPLEAASGVEPSLLPKSDEAARALPEAVVSEIAVVELAPPPLPRRKPELPEAATVAELPAPAPIEAPAAKAETAPPPAREKSAALRPPAREAPKQAAAQTGGGLFGLWKPMALAPADKPVAPAKPATARPSSGAYASQVWSRLARHKPRAGQRGSASVSFTIGELGALRGAQIARSSGNARIDQLALQTVRGAAPFPAPPSGAVSYTIRIDF